MEGAKDADSAAARGEIQEWKGLLEEEKMIL